jgi:hypothetical protein
LTDSFRDKHGLSRCRIRIAAGNLPALAGTMGVVTVTQNCRPDESVEIADLGGKKIWQGV